MSEERYQYGPLCYYKDIPLGSLYVLVSEGEVLSSIRRKTIDGGIYLKSGELKDIGSHSTGQAYRVVTDTQDVRDPDASIFALAYLSTDKRWIDIASCKEGELDKIKQHIEDYKRYYPKIKVVLTHITHTVDMQVNFNPVVGKVDGLTID